MAKNPDFDDEFDLEEIQEEPQKTSAGKNLKKGLAGSGRMLMGAFGLIIIMVILGV